MITDKATNALYLADTLARQHPDFYSRFTALLDCCKANHAILPHTKDIWAVDYMPVQVSTDRFVQFKYNPDYLQSKKWLKTISNVDVICGDVGLSPLKTDIVLDGGNIVKWVDKVIMCDKVFQENPQYTRHQLIKKLEDVFEVAGIYFVPQQPYDYTGHADGMLRFLDGDIVLINDYAEEDDNFKRAFYIALHNAGLKYITIPYLPHAKHAQANGCYINYLQMDELIVIPTFGIREDDTVVRQFEQLFSGQQIATIESNEIAKEGGVLNCITWNIKTRTTVT